MWDKLKAACLHSLTIAWSYTLIATGMIGPALDLAAMVVADPTFTEAVQRWVPEGKMSAFSVVAGAITFAARLRGILAAKES